MTIEEIKEWRKEGGSPHYRANEIIDTLLAEAERLNDCKGCDAPRQLTVATEALDRTVEIYSDPCMNNGFKLEEIVQTARTALERIKG